MQTRILVVDDDSAVRSALVRALAVGGYQVESASGGYEGIRALDARSYALVLTDIHMAEGDGLELLIHARKHHPTVPVITMSGREEGALLDSALGLGARAVLAKPFSMQQLLECVARALPGEVPGAPAN